MEITAKFDSSCKKCGGKIAGRDYRIGGGSGYGYCGYSVGQTVRSTENQRGKKYPEFLTIVACGKNYYREDGMSFGVGDDSGYFYWADCREATADEAAPILEAEAKALKIKTTKQRLSELEQAIREGGERPEEANPEGHRILDTRNIYGGGSWWVIGTDKIWYIQNNGMDGDNWAYNNVRTGGAGAIGWYVDFDKKLKSELYKIEESVGLKKKREEAELKQKINASYSSRRGEIIYQDDEGRSIEICGNGSLVIKKKGADKSISVKSGRDFEATSTGPTGQQLPGNYVRYGEYPSVYCPRNIAKFLKNFDIFNEG